MPSRMERLGFAKDHYKRLGRTKEVHEDEFSDGDWWSDDDDQWEEQPSCDEAQGDDGEERSGMVAHSSFNLIDALAAASARRHEQLAKKRALRQPRDPARAKKSADEDDEASAQLREVLRERGVKLGSPGKLDLLDLRRIEAATRIPIVEDDEEEATVTETEALSVVGEVAAVAPDDESGGLPSLAVELPFDCWTEIVPFLGLEPILRLSHASQMLRGVVEDTGVWRRLWKLYIVSASDYQVVFSRRGEKKKTAWGVPLSELPYQYRWSGLWSLRHAVIDQQMNPWSWPKFRRLADAQRVLDAQAWRELYEMTHSELVAEWARLMANKAAGNPNLALKILDSLDMEPLPAAVKKMLRVPSTDEERGRLESQLMVDTLSHCEEDEEDVTVAEIVTLTPMSVVNDVEEHKPKPRDWTRIPDYRRPGEGGRRFHRTGRRPHRGEHIAPSVKTQIENMGEPDKGTTQVLHPYRRIRKEGTGLVNSRNNMSARIARYADTNPVDILQHGPPENGPRRANGPYKLYDAREYYDTEWVRRRW